MLTALPGVKVTELAWSGFSESLVEMVTSAPSNSITVMMVAFLMASMSSAGMSELERMKAYCL